MHGEEESLSGQRLSKDHSYRNELSLAVRNTYIYQTAPTSKAVLPIELGGAQAPGPSKEGARDWQLGRFTGAPITKATTPPIY